ncbi:MAG: UrcA family protein [Sphingomicrobium sp.]
MNRIIIASTLLFASSTISSACIAAPNEEATLQVSYDDLDLSTPAGLKALHRRIGRAADEACARASYPELGQQTDLACTANARAEALSHVPQAIAEQRLRNSPALAEAKPR